MSVKTQYRYPVYKRSPSFSRLMEMYERNYILLRMLLGDVRVLEGRYASNVGGMTLYVEVIEQCPYTTILNMSYQRKMGETQAWLPNAHVRIYHDARTAELLQRTKLEIHTRRLITQPASSLPARWELSRFFYKWMCFLRYKGHSRNSLNAFGHFV